MASSAYFPIAPSIGIKNRLCNQELALWLQIASESSDDGDITHRPHGSEHLLPWQSPYIRSVHLAHFPSLPASGKTLPDLRPFFSLFSHFVSIVPIDLSTPIPHNVPLSCGTVLAWCGLSFTSCDSITTSLFLCICLWDCADTRRGQREHGVFWSRSFRQVRTTHLGVGNDTVALCKSTKHTSLLSPLSLKSAYW